MGIFSTVLPSDNDTNLYPNFPRDMDDWTCSNWLNYYKNLKEKYGKDKALQIFTTDIEKVGWFANVHNCKYDCDWIAYFKAEGLTGGNFISKIYCTGVNTVDTVSDVAGNVGDAVKTVTDKKFIIGAGILFAAYLFYKHQKNGKKQ